MSTSTARGLGAIVSLVAIVSNPGALGAMLVFGAVSHVIWLAADGKDSDIGKAWKTFKAWKMQKENAQ